MSHVSGATVPFNTPDEVADLLARQRATPFLDVRLTLVAPSTPTARHPSVELVIVDVANRLVGAWLVDDALEAAGIICRLARPGAGGVVDIEGDASLGQMLVAHLQHRFAELGGSRLNVRHYRRTRVTR